MTNLQHWQYYLKDVTSPESFIEWSFYFLIGAALQRRVWIGSEREPIFPNPYLVLVGPPSVGKGRVIMPVIDMIKTHKKFDRTEEMQKMAEEMTNTVYETAESCGINPSGTMSKLEPPLLIAMAPESVTYEALMKLNAKSTSRINVKEKCYLAPNGIYTHQSLCFCLEEMSSLFKQQADQVIKYLITAYSGGDYNYVTKNQGEDRIRKPCLSLLAGTTPSFMQECMDEKILDDGFSSRTIFVYEQEPRKHTFMRPDLTPEQLASWSYVAKHIKLLTTQFGQITYKPEALEFFTEYFEKILPARKYNTSPKLEAYYGRKNLHAQKLAMALHFSDQIDNYVIERHTCEQALEILERTEKKMHMALSFLGKNTMASFAGKTKRMLQKEGPMTFIEIWARYAAEIKELELREVLEYLEKTKQIGRLPLSEKEPETKYIWVKE